MSKRSFFIPLAFLYLFLACQQTTEQVATTGDVEGTVSRVLSNGAVAVHPAFIFDGDSLLATTDLQGHYRLTALPIGTYQITSSALLCGDTTLSVQVLGGRTVTLDFNLKPESATGKVYGEFQDGVMFQQRLTLDTSLVNWSEKKMFDAATGATLILKILGYEVPECTVLLADSTIATADA